MINFTLSLVIICPNKWTHVKENKGGKKPRRCGKKHKKRSITTAQESTSKSFKIHSLPSPDSINFYYTSQIPAESHLAKVILYFQIL